LTKRTAVAKVVAVAVMAVLISAGAIGIYFYTSAPTNNFTSTSTNTSSTSTTGAPATGSQDSSGQPQGSWSDYLGYLPAGYTLAPHYPNAPIYQCPSGMGDAQCKQFQAACGNGVCDPNESCATCALDCGVAGALTCDPYTGRPGSPISICQVGGLGA
jgi:hypothetical protein